MDTRDTVRDGTPAPAAPRGPRPTTVDRRDVLRATLVLGAGAVLAACTGPEETARRRAPTTTAPEATDVPTTAPSGASTLLVYFSRPGENYWYGDRRDLEVGNTEVLATMVAERTRCDVHRIEAADAYPHDYAETRDRNVREQDADARPEIADALPDVAGYTTVVLASPIWNVRPPMIMSTFVDGVDLTGKVVLPVVTYAVSGLGRTIDVYRDLLPGVDLGEGLAVRGEEVAAAGPDVDAWIARVLAV